MISFHVGYFGSIIFYIKKVSYGKFIILMINLQTENGESELEKTDLKDKKVKASVKRLTSDELAQVKQVSKKSIILLRHSAL